MKPLIPPPGGYRLLAEGEIIEEGDLCLRCDRLPWIPATAIGHAWAAYMHYPMCRKIEKESTP